MSASTCSAESVLSRLPSWCALGAKQPSSRLKHECTHAASAASSRTLATGRPSSASAVSVQYTPLMRNESEATTCQSRSSFCEHTLGSRHGRFD